MVSPTQPETTRPNRQTVQEVSKQKALGRFHGDYWKSRLWKNSYTRDGETFEVNEWSVKVQHLGIRRTIALGTSNKDAAAVKARDFYQTLVAQGWEAAMAKYNPAMLASDKVSSVGQYLEAVKLHAGISAPTYAVYARKFRTMVGGVFSIQGNDAKFDYRNGGRAKWLERINRVKLDKLTPQKIEAWKTRYLKAAEKENPLAHKRAEVTINSVIRSAKALFTADVIKAITGKVVLPKTLPVEGVKNVTISTKRFRYKSSIDAGALITAAQRELRDGIQEAEEGQEPPEPKPEVEAYKILLLALLAGLRRDEIDTLTFKQINWQKHVICVETTKDTNAKTDSSEAEVNVDPDLLKILKGYMKPGCGPFLIASPVEAKPTTSTYSHYRCNRHFDILIRWLRNKGVDSNNPLHTLRKEFGSLVCRKAGIYAASMALRHSSIQLTAMHYIDTKDKTPLMIGDLLKPEPATVTAHKAAKQ